MINAFWLMIGFVLTTFLLDWLAVGFSWKTLERILKPLALVMVIIWTLTAVEWTVDLVVLLLVLGQGLGLIGDVLLQLDKRWFLWGLAAFLLGHLFYLSLLGLIFAQAFRSSAYLDFSTWIILLSVVVWVGIIAGFYVIFSPVKYESSRSPVLWVAIQVYGWILSILMVFSILGVLISSTLSIKLLLLPTGAILFFISDSLLAYDRFRKTLPNSRVYIMITYHLAQFGLAWGFLANFGMI